MVFDISKLLNPFRELMDSLVGHKWFLLLLSLIVIVLVYYVARVQSMFNNDLLYMWVLRIIFVFFRG